MLRGLGLVSTLDVTGKCPGKVVKGESRAIWSR